MRYLKYVRVDEVVTRAKKRERAETIRNAGQSMEQFPKTKPKKVVAKGKALQDLGNSRLASIEQGQMVGDAIRKGNAEPPGTARASIAVGRDQGKARRKALAALNTSFVPLTLPNLMEINIVKGSDGKPVVASGNGTRLKNIAQPTEAALKRRRAGTQHAGSERLLKSKQASDRRTALIKRGRRKEATQVPSPPASTDGIGGNRPGGDAGTGEAIRHRIASRGHTR